MVNPDKASNAEETQKHHSRMRLVKKAGKASKAVLRDRNFSLEEARKHGACIHLPSCSFDPDEVVVAAAAKEISRPVQSRVVPKVQPEGDLAPGARPLPNQVLHVLVAVMLSGAPGSPKESGNSW